MWLAPEQPDPTYLSDDEAVDITPTETGCLVVQPVDQRSGLQKTLEITLDQKQARVEILHGITNHADDPITGSFWAITQFKLGGHALMPLNNTLTDNNPTLPNRSIILWPYTDFNNPNITWGNELVAIRAQTDEPLKIGTAGTRGWLAYWYQGTLFIKYSAYVPNAEYWGYGSTLECYCNHQFLELETLAPITTLQPGETGYHTETWHIFPDVEWDKNIPNTVNFIESHLQTV
ncbi:MAG: hypothetical protein GWN30_27425 [Gammaproteobacteria bacterium]|nr:hypothetical protein [Gammaproteobacteria bacterium]